MESSGITVTVRLIKSFEYRTFKNFVLHNINPAETTPFQLKEITLQEILKGPAFRPYHKVKFDTLKIYMKAHGAKTQNLIINLDHEDWILDDTKTLLEQGIDGEVEISFFNREAYEAFKLNPEIKW
ncbi:hypothetical protein HK098_002234 [Nowakowskiella sp. JEL0407]|nr:hypothetical protein HK098_002234 [Nowakowskiella sp. JEL0407]